MTKAHFIQIVPFSLDIETKEIEIDHIPQTKRDEETSGYYYGGQWGAAAAAAATTLYERS